MLSSDQLRLLIDLFHRKPHPENYSDTFDDDMKFLTDNGWMTPGGPIGDRTLTPEGVYKVRLLRELASVPSSQLEQFLHSRAEEIALREIIMKRLEAYQRFLTRLEAKQMEKMRQEAPPKKRRGWLSWFCRP